MGAYDPETGFRNGSLAQRNPRAYFAIFGVSYAAIWLVIGLADHGHHHLTGKYVGAAIVVAIVLGALVTAIHYGVWRVRTARGRNPNARKLS